MKAKRKEWIILSILILIASVALIFLAVSFGACTGNIVTAEGGQVPMKCFWTMKTVKLLAVLPIVLSVVQLFLKEKESKMVAALAILISSLLILMITTNMGIGVCKVADMICRHTAVYIRVDLILIGIISAIQIVRAAGKDKQPRRGF